MSLCRHIKAYILLDHGYKLARVNLAGLELLRQGAIHTLG